MVLYEVLVTDEYEHIGDLGSPKFIVDGGANIGLVSVYFLNRYPTARIVAVEPDAETLKVCQKNLAPYGDRVTSVHGAIWSHSGTLCLEPAALEFSTSVRAASAGENASVQAFTVPSLIAMGGSVVDLLKLDVERAELEIFGPSAQGWLSSANNIAIELHGPDCVDCFFSAMEPYEYAMSNRDNVYVCRNIRPRVRV
jgi:FkbM family methyltransferase